LSTREHSEFSFQPKIIENFTKSMRHYLSQKMTRRKVPALRLIISEDN
jgi:hypothetical protein